MGQPKRIILLRHGESEGNADKSKVSQKPSYTYELTEKGRKQAFTVGQELRKLIGDESVRFYCSPYWRTRQTYQQVIKSFDPKYHKLYEDPRLREQERGHIREQAVMEKLDDERDNYGHFYYRFKNGESCADVYDRISDFLGTLYRDFKKTYFPDNVIIVGHGMENRVFLMRFFHYSVEEFERLANLKNCEYYVLNIGKYGHYTLDNKPREYKNPTHKYQFKW